MDEQKRKWSSEAGPIQTKKVANALGAIGTEASYRTEVSGVHDGRTADEVVAAFTGREPDGDYDFSVSDVWSFGIGGAADSAEAAQDAKAKALATALGERFGWTITRANYTQVIAGAAEAVAEIRKTRPIIDKRDTAEERAESAAIHAEYAAKDAAVAAAHKALADQVTAKRPAGAAALITAEWHEDNSHLQSDYFADRTEATVAIGWRYGKREDFKQLRAAAEAFFKSDARLTVQCHGKHYGEGTCNHGEAGVHPYEVAVDEGLVAALTEHRDNYSMGAGNYLSTFGYSKGTGWTIQTGGPTYLTHDALPEPPSGAEPTSGEGFAVRDSKLRAGYVEVTFPAKPDEAIRAELKSAGFRWALRTACWYGPASALPARYKEAA